MGLEAYEASLCRCGQPRAVAWHSEMDGWFDTEGVVCHACTARNDGEQVAYTFVTDTRPHEHRPLPPFEFGITTTPAD